MKKPLEIFRLLVSLLAGLVTAALVATLAYAQAAKPSQNSRWLTESGNLEVVLAPCNGALCGTVVKVLANRSMSAPSTEMPATVMSQLIGMVILSDFKAGGDGEWKGKIFNRENSRLYSAVMTMPTHDQLVIRSYVGLPLFGKTQVWRRIDAEESDK